MAGIGISIFLGALIVIAVIAMIVLLGAWVYRDADNKGMNGFLWMIIVLLVPSFIGLIIYLIVRMDNQKVVCSNCNTQVNGKNKFCSNCGVELKPVIDYSEDDAAFKKSQRNILIGFFSTFAAIIVLTVMMVAFLITGVLKITTDAITWAGKLSTTVGQDTLSDVLEDTLGDLDVLFDEDEVHISIRDDKLTVTDKAGNQLLHVDGDKESVDVDLGEIKKLLERYNIEYDESISEEELEERIEEEIEKNIRENLEDALDELEEK